MKIKEIHTYIYIYIFSSAFPAHAHTHGNAYRCEMTARGEFKARSHRRSFARRHCRRRRRRRCHRCGHHHRRHAGSKYTHKSMPPDGQSSSLVSLLSADDVTARIIYARLVCGTRKRLDESSGIRVPRIAEEKEEIPRLLRTHV